MNSMFEKRRGICTKCTEFGAAFSKIALKIVQYLVIFALKLVQNFKSLFI